MFANLTVDTAALLQRVFYECPCKYVPLDELKDQWAKKLFNMRALKNPVAPSALKIGCGNERKMLLRRSLRWKASGPPF